MDLSDLGGRRSLHADAMHLPDSTRCALAERRCDASPASDRFWTQWQDDIRNWWLFSPIAPTIGSCAGALSLHLASRLDAAWRALRFGADAPPARPRSSGGSDVACEQWVEESADAMQLPGMSIRQPSCPPGPPHDHFRPRRGPPS